MKLIISCFVFAFSLLSCSVNGDKEPIECQILVDRSQGFTFCQFTQINGTEKDVDVSKVKALTTMFQGRVIESDLVTAISISFSTFDQIPSSVFTGFGEVYRFKFYDGKVKTIQKESFVSATKLRFFEMIDSKIEEIADDAFEGAEKLEEITFENCKIGKISENAFTGLDNLKKIKLIGSKYPDTDFLKNLPKKVVVDMQNTEAL